LGIIAAPDQEFGPTVRAGLRHRCIRTKRAHESELN
jgi:hypothetical protein